MKKRLFMTINLVIKKSRSCSQSPLLQNTANAEGVVCRINANSFQGINLHLDATGIYFLKLGTYVLCQTFYCNARTNA